MNTELYHYGVKGMKWGVRKRRKIINAAAEKASMWGKAANKGAKDYETFAKNVKNDKTRSKVDKEGSYKLNMAISKELARMGKEYTQMSEAYRSMKASEVSKEDIRRAKAFLKETMTIDMMSYNKE